MNQALQTSPTKKIYIRNCSVCNSAEKHILFHQSFEFLSEGSLLAGFDLAACNKCGAVYADNIPNQDEFDKYYTEMSKYEYTNREGVQTDTDLSRFKEVVDLVTPHLKKSHRLLDIGCATGGLLAEFKSRGFYNLFGVDPSPSCSMLTTQLYGIKSEAIHISAIKELGQSADVIFLTGVLEHIRDVNASIESLKSCLNKGGFIYFEVPDASRYENHFSAPFQFFSMEHINYFSPLSLNNLMSRHGFSVVFNKRLIRHLSPQAIEPTIGALFCSVSLNQSPTYFSRDEETEPALKRYIQQSRELETRIHAKISGLVDAGKPLAVWGTGTHTLRLLETSSLPQAKIVAFIDSNVHYQGKTLVGVPIISPSEFKDRNAEILISSQTAEKEIFEMITNDFKWDNVTHRLYAD